VSSYERRTDDSLLASADGRTRSPRTLDGVRSSAWKAVLLVAVMLSAGIANAQVDPKPEDSRGADKKVGKRLIRKAGADADEDLMTNILEMMQDSSRRLEIDFDPGRDTQTVQAGIVEQLDEVIKVAASRRRPRSRSMPSGTSDKRRKPGERSKASDGSDEETSQGDQADSGTTDGKPGSQPGAESTRGDLREVRETWGHLPMRDREEVIQGIGETFLERYREWIERYYRALQESDE